jgi:CRISPR-associated protein Cmr1
MKQLNYTLSFTTPAFLGNAEQQAQWRTPPIKALIRQWWRVVYAAEHRFQVNLDAMRREEGLLFGNAWLSHQEGDRPVTDHCKSLVRIRLSTWNPGDLSKQKWGQQELEKDWKVHHPEVGKIGPMLYLGYGPLEVAKVQRQGQHQPEYATALKKNAAIQSGEFATLSIAVPEDHAPRIEQALMLMDRYGTLGGRSRNGWGSFSLTPFDVTPPLTEAVPLRLWADALDRDWPHAIGLDDKGALVWQTPACADWKALMREMAILKIGMRRLFLFPNERPDGEVHERHWLSYPVTKHNVRAWDRGKLRLPNSLRFKVRTAPDGKLVGVIFHVPCLPPAEFHPDRRSIERVWQRVHGFLDAPAQELSRIPA